LYKQLIFILALCFAFLAAGCSGSVDDSSADSGPGSDDDAAADDDQAADDDTVTDDDSLGDDDVTPDIELLLEQFRPVVIQQLAGDYDQLPYAETSDRIGALSVHPGDDDFEYTVRVDTDSPVVYGDWRMVQINNQDRLQLLYMFFYPERPISIEMQDDPLVYWQMFIWSGAIDGKVVRITLDADQQTPLFIEVARNCGCDWQFYVNKLVDDAAREEFEGQGLDYPGLVKSDAPNDVQYVHVMPADVAERTTDRIAIVAENGWTDYPHRLLGAFTSYEQWQGSDLPISNGMLYLNEYEKPEDFAPEPLVPQTYQMMNYDLLYELPLAETDQPVGIFDAFHYVWNSYTPLTNWMRHQCCFIKYPGTPKDPDYLEVVHETIDFWDPALYDTFIYLPESLFGTGE